MPLLNPYISTQPPKPEHEPIILCMGWPIGVPLAIARLVSQVCMSHRVNVHELRRVHGKYRVPFHLRHRRARAELCAVLHDIGHMSYPEISRFVFGHNGNSSAYEAADRWRKSQKGSPSHGQ